MNYEVKQTEDFSHNLDERTGILMREVYDEIKLSDMLVLQKKQTIKLDILNNALSFVSLICKPNR